MITKLHDIYIFYVRLHRFLIIIYNQMDLLDGEVLARNKELFGHFLVQLVHTLI